MPSSNSVNQRPRIPAKPSILAISRCVPFLCLCPLVLIHLGLLRSLAVSSASFVIFPTSRSHSLSRWHIQAFQASSCSSNQSSIACECSTRGIFRAFDRIEAGIICDSDGGLAMKTSLRPSFAFTYLMNSLIQSLYGSKCLRSFDIAFLAQEKDDFKIDDLVLIYQVHDTWIVSISQHAR